MAEETRLVRVEERLKIKIGRNDTHGECAGVCAVRECFPSSMKTRVRAYTAVNPVDNDAISPGRAITASEFSRAALGMSPNSTPTTLRAHLLLPSCETDLRNGRRCTRGESDPPESVGDGRRLTATSNFHAKFASERRVHSQLPRAVVLLHMCACVCMLVYVCNIRACEVVRVHMYACMLRVCLHDRAARKSCERTYQKSSAALPLLGRIHDLSSRYHVRETDALFSSGLAKRDRTRSIKNE